MAECFFDLPCPNIDWKSNIENFFEQKNEILALESFFENTENFDILEHGSIENSQIYSLQFKLQINTKEKNSKVEIWLPIESSNLEVEDLLTKDDLDDKKEASCIVEPKENKNKTIFNRSKSGKSAFTTIICEFLPPLLLDIKLPCEYPSISGPLYKISSNWLNKYQMSLLCNKLDQIWEENFDIPVLYTWVEWLQSNLISFLELDDLVISPFEKENNQSKYDKRVFSLFTDVDDLIFQFLRHNYVEEFKYFRRNIQNCLICFDEKIGSEFFRLDECKHHFCLDCMTSMCQMHVKEGTIELLKCPHKDCKEFVSIDLMQQVLNKEEFERWERFMLQRTLDTMEDIIYCPKCSNPIVIDENDTHSFCFNCNSDYCKLCKDQWHIGPCLSQNQKFNQRIEKLNLKAEDLLKLTNDQIKERFKDSGFVIELKKKTINAQNEEKIQSILSKYVNCPKCRIPIDKFEGCNKVVCRCGCILCYKCGKSINGYDHFNNLTCNLWSVAPNAAFRIPERPIHDAQRAVARVLEAAPEQQKNLINCPSCGQRCLKMDKNNHLKCWLCATNFCFCCKKRIVGIITNHFKGSTCKQHSD